MRNQQCLACAESENKSLVPRSIIIIRQNPCHDTFTLNLQVALPVFECRLERTVRTPGPLGKCRYREALFTNKTIGNDNGNNQEKQFFHRIEGERPP